jgi:hypothetical protein
LTTDVTIINLSPTLDDETFSIFENATVGSEPGTLVASDPGNDPITYAIVGGSGQSSFVIDPVTGVITVADFYRDQLFRKKGKKAAGPAKVDARFLAVAFAVYFTDAHLAGTVAADYGFNVTDVGTGGKVMNIGSAGVAFDVADDSDMTILQILLATNGLTDRDDGITGFAHIYDRDGDGKIDSEEAALRNIANGIFSAINGFESD